MRFEGNSWVGRACEMKYQFEVALLSNYNTRPINTSSILQHQVWTLGCNRFRML